MKIIIVFFATLCLAALLASFLIGYFRQNRLAHRCTPPGEFISVAGNNIHYIERKGEGVAVVFLHGASSNAREWQQSLFDYLAHSYHLVAIDRPGLGHSDRAPGTDLQRQVEIVHQAVKKLQLVRPILVVHSLSGVIGARLLVDYPGQYQGLVILSGATYPIGSGSSWYTRLATQPLLGDLFRYAVVPTFAPVLAPQFVEKSFYPQAAVDDYSQKVCLELLFSPRRFLANAEDLNQIRAFLDESYPLYPKIEEPVSLIYGTQDQVLAQFSHAGGFAYQVPKAKPLMLPDLGHMPHYFYQDIIAQEIDRIRFSHVKDSGSGSESIHERK